MAISYLDNTPAEQARLNPYVSQYIPVPLEHLHRAGALVQKRGDEALETVDAQGAAIGRSKARSVDEAYRASVQDRYNKEVDDLMAQGLNPASYEFQRAKSKMINKYSNDQNLRNLATLADEEARRKKAASDIQKAGGTTIDFDPTFSQAYQGDIGSFNLGGSPIERTLDRRAGQEKVFNQMKESGSFGRLQGAGVPGLLQRASWKEISQSDVGNLAVNSLQGYLNTDVGDQQYRDYKLQGMTDDEAKKNIFNELLATGQERVHRDTSAQTISDPLAGARFKAGQAQTQAPTNVHTEKMLTAQNPEGATLFEDEVGSFITGRKKAEKMPDGTQGYVVDVGKKADGSYRDDVLYTLGDRQKTFVPGTYEMGTQIANAFSEISGYESSLEALQKGDFEWGNLMLAFRDDEGALESYFDSGTTSTDTGQYTKFRKEDVKKAKEKLDKLKKVDPIAYKAAMANADYFTSGEGMRDANLIKYFNETGTLNVVPTTHEGNFKTVGGDARVEMKAAATVGELKAAGIDPDELIKSGRAVPEAGADEREWFNPRAYTAGSLENDAILYVPGIQVKATPGRLQEREYNERAYGSTLKTGEMLALDNQSNIITSKQAQVKQSVDELQNILLNDLRGNSKDREAFSTKIFSANPSRGVEEVTLENQQTVNNALDSIQNRAVNGTYAGSRQEITQFYQALNQLRRTGELPQYFQQYINKPVY